MTAMNENEARDVLKALGDSVPPPRRMHEHRATFLLEASQLANQSNDNIQVNGGRKTMRKIGIFLAAALLLIGGAALAQELLRFFERSASDSRSMTLYFDSEHAGATSEPEVALPALEQVLADVP